MDYTALCWQNITQKISKSFAVNTLIDVSLLAINFTDWQEKHFISKYSISLSGQPQKTKHYGLIPRCLKAYNYLHYPAGIGIHNHMWPRSHALEYMQRTKLTHPRLFAGVIAVVYQFTMSNGR